MNERDSYNYFIGPDRAGFPLGKVWSSRFVYHYDDKNLAPRMGQRPTEERVKHQLTTFQQEKVRQLFSYVDLHYSKLNVPDIWSLLVVSFSLQYYTGSGTTAMSNSIRIKIFLQLGWYSCSFSNYLQFQQFMHLFFSWNRYGITMAWVWVLVLE